VKPNLVKKALEGQQDVCLGGCLITMGNMEWDYNSHQEWEEDWLFKDTEEWEEVLEFDIGHSLDNQMDGLRRNSGRIDYLENLWTWYCQIMTQTMT